MTAHSTLVGGSIASRRMHCPASYTESLKAPPGVTSVYAEHGTALHDGMAHWLRNPDDDLIGKVFNDHVITAEDDILLTNAWDAQVELQECCGGNFKVTNLELQAAFPGIPGAFGTVDTILQSPTHFLVVDYKFGQGIAVHCVDPETGELNHQLLFYLASVRHLAKGRTMVIAIIQPTFEPHLSYALVTPAELDAFETKLRDAVAEATSSNPRRLRGEWCRFAPCKLTCRLWTGPMLDLTALGRPPQAAPAGAEWGIWLAAAKRLVDSALMYAKEIDQALMDHLKAGGTAPGFALKQQVKNRKWLDDVDLVAKTLKKLGLTDEQIWQRKLQTFAVTDAAAKRLRVTIPDELRPRPQSNDLTLTYEGDPRAVDVKTIAADFAAALKKLERNTT